MKKICIILAIITFTFSTAAISMEISHYNNTICASGPNGPAPNSGDGVPDGSGNDAPSGPNTGK